MSNLHYLSLAEVAARIRRGELSSVEVTRACLERINALEPDLHSYATVLEQHAMTAAERLDGERRAGRGLRPLHGVPVAIKDLLDLQGVATQSGTVVMKDHIAREDATVVARLKEAGAVIVGKTQLTEGAFGAHHPDIVPPVNPWNRMHWTGVSSSGSGVAVAAGLAYAALGSDTGGSIRFPSASCGLVGIKPTYGRVSRHGAFPLAESLDHIGPMARSVQDAALLLECLAGQDPKDTTSLAAPVPDYGNMLSERIPGTRIGVDWPYVSRGVDEVVVQTVREALRLFEELGGEVREIRMPAATQRLIEGWYITCGVECARVHAPFYPSRKELYGPVLSGLLETGRSATADDYQALEHLRGVFRTDLDRLLQGVDLIIAPCMPVLPPDIASMAQRVEDEGERAEFIAFTAPFDYSGHPTITLPAGIAHDRLPKSFQLIGRFLEEPLLIQAGSAYERALGFNERPIP